MVRRVLSPYWSTVGGLGGTEPYLFDARGYYTLQIHTYTMTIAPANKVEWLLWFYDASGSNTRSRTLIDQVVIGNTGGAGAQWNTFTYGFRSIDWFGVPVNDPYHIGVFRLGINSVGFSNVVSLPLLEIVADTR